MYNEKIFKAFSRILLRIDENLGFHGLELSEEDRIIMGDKDYFEYINVINERKDNLYFKNISGSDKFSNNPSNNPLKDLFL